MKIDLGFFYISINKGGIHIEFEKYPFLWLVFNFTNKKGFAETCESAGLEL